MNGRDGISSAPEVVCRYCRWTDRLTESGAAARGWTTKDGIILCPCCAVILKGADMRRVFMKVGA